MKRLHACVVAAVLQAAFAGGALAQPIEEAAEPPYDRPAPADLGVVIGTVTDSKLKEAVIECDIEVLETKTRALTDLDGHFRLELKPGTYTLRITYELHKPAKIENVYVTAGNATRIDAVLEPEQNAGEVIEVVTDVDKTSLEGQTLSRQRSASAGDSVGRAEMAKAPDRNAAEAAKRVVGATVEGSRFVYVRGLGERYTNALLDGAPLPSPEPDRQAVPLDLFPAQILDGLTVVKTFTPDVPGDFAGGSIRIATRRFSDELTLTGVASMGFNTNATFARHLSYGGGTLDFLGVDDGARAIPDGIPDYKLASGAEKPDKTLVAPDELAVWGKRINGNMSATRDLTPPNHGLGFVFANAWQLSDDVRLGALFSLTYDRRYEVRNGEELRTFGLGTDGLRARNDLKVDRGIDRVNWGILGAVTAEFTPNHRIGITGLHSRSADDEVSEISGFHEDRAASLVDTRITFVSRALTFGQIRGDHTFDATGGGTLSYTASLARAERYEPNTRGAVYTLDPSFGYTFEDDTTSGSHFYSDQGETTVGGTLDWAQPLFGKDNPSQLKFGGAVNVRRRAFDARRFRFRPTRGAPVEAFVCPGNTWDPTCPNPLFTDANVGPLLELEENTRPTDAYDASLDVGAGYVMLDAALGKGFRLIVGPRLEVSSQDVSSFDPYDPTVGAIETELFDVSVLPSAGLVWSPGKRSAVRTSITRTLARPQLRELAPFSFTDYFGARETQGNPDLVNTSVTNADLRFEFFPTPKEVLAVSTFFKYFEDPIEQVIQAAGARGVVTFENAKAARLFGLELEARKSLDMFAEVLAPFSVIANVTFAHSTVELDPETARFVTNESRPMSLQAPYIVNAAVDFDEPEWGTRVRVSYNVVGPRLAQVGTQGLPDITEEPRHQLDVLVGQKVGEHVELRGSATNLVDSPVQRTQGEIGGKKNVVQKYTLGQTFSLGASVSY